ncbi:virulence factor [Sphingomonas sp. RP10(2022)]|uniref:Virulence factor n=1 Tax=Sphingomonas liriopis TaxID=2949094 RepID=A0A9X2HYJ3_9SPHN|nr:virulence factor [Sphingomonas liriopis]
MAVGAFVVLVAVAGVAGFFDRDPVHVFAAEGKKRPVGVLYLSGDMGLRFGPAPDTVRALANAGIGVVALNAPTLFARRRTRGEVDRIVADGVRAALARTGAGRLVLIGQSYGADMLQTGLAALPARLRAHVAGVVLVVPGDTVFLRADPSGLSYRGTPDGIAAATLARLDWAPLTCIYGVEETDSACPDVHLPGARIVAMPGGHYLNDDHARLFGHILAAIRRAAPGAFR